MKWSILICAIPERILKYEALWRYIAGQARDVLGDNWKESIEIIGYLSPLVNEDGPFVGQKRNTLLNASRGKYISFVDDDDWVAPTYVKKILKGIETNSDVICFNVAYKSGSNDQVTHFSIKHDQNVNSPDPAIKIPHDHVRMPNHIMVVKREHALRAGFPEKNFGEDTAYGVRLRGPRVTSLLKTEYKIEESLYHYRFNRKSSRTHVFNPLAVVLPKGEPILKMDVVIVSDGTRHSMMTNNAVKSIDSGDTNIIVIEKDASLIYEGATTYPQKQPFNYNQCLNSGADKGNCDLICFSNNDVIFPNGFAKQVYNLVEEKKCDVVSFKTQTGFIHPEIISGYCFVMTRDAYNRIIKLNEEYEFWCADNITSEQIRAAALREYKSDIIVTHFVSETLKRIDKGTYDKYTKGCVQKFNRDFDRDIFNWGKAPHNVAV